nr:hypothetical protein Q903MT_gene4782 [Picea sitchensis]
MFRFPPAPHQNMRLRSCPTWYRGPTLHLPRPPLFGRVIKLKRLSE